MDINKYIKDNFPVEEGKASIIVSNFFRPQLYKLFKVLEFKTGCEIGLMRGKNAAGMFKYIPELKLYLVDSYMDYDGSQRKYGQKNINAYMEEAITRLKGKNYEFFKMKSHDACKYIPDESLDFIYIDGNHKYSYMMNDLIDWYPKIKKGGIMSGHDFFNRPTDGFGVKAAVKNYVAFYGISPLYVTYKNERRKFYPSWFFIKEE